MRIKYINQGITDITSIESVDYIFNTCNDQYTFNVSLSDIQNCIKYNVFSFDVHPSVIQKTTSIDIVVHYNNGDTKYHKYTNLEDLEDVDVTTPTGTKQIKSFNTTSLIFTNSASPYDNTAENKQLVIDIVEDMFETVAKQKDDVIRGTKNLIYSSVFGQDYYELFKLLMNSIDSTTTNKTFDILVITDAPTKRRITSSTFAKKFNMNYMVVDTPINGIEASKTKCRIFEWEKINDYKKILFLDSDIVAFKDIALLFDIEYDSEILHTAYNSNMNFERAFNSKYYSITLATDTQLAAYKEHHQLPFNAGQFLFINSIKMQQHFSNVNWLMNNWPGEYFFEQSFMVQYFCRNFLTNSTTINPHFTIKIITPSQYDPDVTLTDLTTFIHFAGAALNGSAKIDYIKNFIANHANIVW